MASNTRGPRGRSRKRRPGAAERVAKAEASRPAEDVPGRTAARSSRRRAPAYRNFDERPQAPWHPLPLSELLILAGAIAFVIALIRLSNHGIGSTGPLLLVGILAVGLGTAEFSWREHRSGFRSHTLLLAFVPVLAMHTVVLAGYSLFASPPPALNLGMFAVDTAVFLLLARHLRARYINARSRR